MTSQSSELIKVIFVDSENEEVLGESEMFLTQLPDSFAPATQVHLFNADWEITEAIPAAASEFAISKQLLLKLRKLEMVDPSSLLFSLPSIASELPDRQASPEFNDFEYEIREDDWRQNEFLKSTDLEVATEEIQKVQEIWQNFSQELETMTAFRKCHARNLPETNLGLDFEELKTLLGSTEVGHLNIHGSEGVVQNAFVIKTDHTVYYGTVQQNLVGQLCVAEFSEDTLKEIRILIRQFNLIFISWYGPDLITEQD